MSLVRTFYRIKKLFPNVFKKAVTVFLAPFLDPAVFVLTLL